MISEPICFGPDRNLFGWLHIPNKHNDRPAVVLCNPVGYEFIRTYRNIRHLAEHLASRGYYVLRFDYYSTGDSDGDELENNRLDGMLSSIHAAVDSVCEHASRDRVSVIGLRLGATLAARIAEQRNFEQVVLWAPCESGALYVREQQIMAAAQSKSFASAKNRKAMPDGIGRWRLFSASRHAIRAQHYDPWR